MKASFISLLLTICIKTFGQTLKDCSTCSINVIKSEQIKNLSIDELRFLTNDLFARKGYVFKNSEIDNYYSDLKWYKRISDNNKVEYNNIEKQNIKFFQDRTLEIKNDRENLIKELKGFKTALMNDDKLVLSNKYNYSIINNGYKVQFEYLKMSFRKINLDDINWSFDEGIYDVSIDNGAIVMNYNINLNRKGCNVMYGNQGGSKIGKQIYPNEHITEFTFFWNFEWKNNKLTFIKMDMAG